ncbi:MAG: BatD family protein [Methanosarcinaceae archaeon]
MIKLNRTLLLVLCSVLFLVMLVGNAYARVEIYNGSITEGDGYQINNFVIDVTDVFVSANTVVFKVYERDELKIDKMINRNDSITFDFDGGEVELRLMSVFSATLPRARVFITVSNYNIANLHANEIINGGHEYATYSGTPVIEIIKTVDKDNITVGDTITVTVTAKNTGDDKATNVIFSDPKQEYFILDKSVLEQNGPMSMDAGTSQTVFVYMLKATDDGTFTLKPSTATFSNSANQDFPQASSTTPTVMVTGMPKENAVLELSTCVDTITVARNDQVTATINIKNTGDAPANAVWIDMIIPQEFKFVSGDSAIEIIDGMPKIYMESFGLQQEKEFTYTVKANELGTYTLTTELSYEYDNGVDAEKQKISVESVTGNIYVQKGKYDELLEQPIYVYALPIIIIVVIGAWIYHRHKQYKF